MKVIYTTFLILLVISAHSKDLPKSVTGNSSPATVAALSEKHAALSFIENKGQVTDQEYKQRTDIQFRLAAAPGLNIFIGNGAIHYQFSKNDDLSELGKQNFGFSGQPKKDLPVVKTHTLSRMDLELIGANKNARVFTEGKLDYYENYFTANTNGKCVTAHAYNRVTYKNIYPNIDWVLYVRNGQLEHEFVINDGGNVADIQLLYGGADEIKLNDDGSLTTTTSLGSITEQAPHSYQIDGNIVKSNFKLSGNVVSYETGSYTGRLVIDPVLEWATYFGGTGDDYGQGLAISNTGNVYINGWTNSTVNIATSGAYHVTYSSGAYDGYIAKFDSTGAIQWATYLGGPGDDESYGIALDSSENVYVTGATSSISGIATSGTHQTVEGDGGTSSDAFIAKFSSTGIVQWATYYGGIGADVGRAVVADNMGNVFVGGYTSSTSSISTIGAYQVTYGGIGPLGYGDAFLAEFNSSGNLQWGTYFGGSLDDGIWAITRDNAGYIFAAMGVNSASGISTPGAYQSVYGGNCDGCLAKFSSSGSIQWSTYFGSSGNDYALDVVTDGSGDVYITGATTSTSGIATTGASQPVYGGGPDDAFLAKFNNTGAVQWATYFGGGGDDDGRGVVTDIFGNVYVAGNTNSVSGIATPSAYQASYGGGSDDGYLTKFNDLGVLQYATYYGGPDDDKAGSCKSTPSGALYFTGSTVSNSGIATSPTYQPAFGGGASDAFLAKFLFCTMPSAGSIGGADSVCLDSAILFTESAAGGTWSSSNPSIATVTAGRITGNAIGLDTISYSVANACGTAVAKKTVYITRSCTEGINSTSLPAPNISLFPNPAQDNITITASVPINNVVISNMVGQTIFAASYNTDRAVISLARFPTGIYMVKVNNTDVRKLIKE